MYIHILYGVVIEKQWYNIIWKYIIVETAEGRSRSVVGIEYTRIIIFRLFSRAVPSPPRERFSNIHILKDRQLRISTQERR